MAADRKDHIITVHVRERYVQRTNKKFAHLQNCRSVQCYNCDALNIEVRRFSRENKEAIDAEIYKRLEEADEDRSYLNNSWFMQGYYEKHGYEKSFDFLVSRKILFVVVHDEGQKVMVTCVLAKTHLAGKSLLAKTKFSKVSKVKTKEEKLLQDAVTV